MEKDLSDIDIYKIIGRRIPCLKYSELSKYVYDSDKFYELLYRNGGILILYPTLSPTVGHWTIVTYHNGTLEFFDSYGIQPDHEKLLISNNVLNRTGASLNFLTSILKKSKYDYNNYEFQEYRKGVNTCGRWCADRFNNRELSINQYKNYVLSSKGNMTLDQWVVSVTSVIIEH